MMICNKICNHDMIILYSLVPNSVTTIFGFSPTGRHETIRIKEETTNLLNILSVKNVKYMVELFDSYSNFLVVYRFYLKKQHQQSPYILHRIVTVWTATRVLMSLSVQDNATVWTLIWSRSG